jgi:hypothetical protein
MTGAARKLEAARGTGTVPIRTMEQTAQMAKSAAAMAGTVGVPGVAVVAVRGLLAGASEVSVARRLGLSRHLLVRIAAGRRVRAGSLALLLAALAALPEGR